MKKDLAIIFSVIAVIAIAVFCGIYFSDCNKPSDKVDKGEAKGSVTISIRCDTILDHLDKLDPALNDPKYVPRNGIILDNEVIAIYENYTVFDVLKDITAKHNIKLIYSDPPPFYNIYVSGINHISEKSVGSGGGWLYKHNGLLPKVSCDKTLLSDGDKIIWAYSCVSGDITEG